MKILHIVAGNLYGGVETFIHTLANSDYQTSEMEPEFALCFKGRLWNELRNENAIAHDLGPVRFSRPWTASRAKRRLRRLMSERSYDIVVCHMPWIQGLFGDVAQRFGPGFVAYIHGPRTSGWVEFLAARQKPRMAIGPSHHSVNSYKSTFPNIPFEVLNYPIPPKVKKSLDLSPSQRQDMRASLNSSEDDVVILQASRIESWKGPDLVIRALTQLKDVPGWTFWLAGGIQRASEQALYSKLRQIAQDGGIESRVRFLGERSDVWQLMRAADIYTQGNRMAEGFSLSFLEASYCGLPIVTTDLGGASDVVGPENGILVPADENPALLASSLRELIVDRDRRNKMSQEARRKSLLLSDTRQQLMKLSDYLHRAPDNHSG